jgi:hypothetical protein
MDQGNLTTRGKVGLGQWVGQAVRAGQVPGVDRTGGNQFEPGVAPYVADAPRVHPNVRRGEE